MDTIMTQSLKERIKYILKTIKISKDSDEILFLIVNSKIKNDEITSKGIYLSKLYEDMTLLQFLGYFTNLQIGGEKFYSFKTIERIRRKLQEEFIELRGINYTKRQNLGKEFKKEIKSFNISNNNQLTIF